jgi:hypothetical protein
MKEAFVYLIDNEEVIKVDEDDHLNCPSWPACHAVPAGCVHINDALRGNQ